MNAPIPTNPQNKNIYGKSVPWLSLPETSDMQIGERQPYRFDILYCCTQNGYPHHQELAARYLVAGRFYTARSIVVEQSSSRVELEAFPGVWFNTALFTNWNIRGGLLEDDANLIHRNRFGEHTREQTSEEQEQDDDDY